MTQCNSAVDSGLHERPTYYGRVIRDGGWTVLHYMFFYAMNDWRSAFGGVNDHEGDWEQIMVFCDGGATASWILAGWPTRHTITMATTSVVPGKIAS